MSWGKIRIDAAPVKVYGDASLIFPLLISQTFAKELQRRQQQQRGEEGSKGQQEGQAQQQQQPANGAPQPQKQ